METNRDIHTIDAEGKPPGRIATEVVMFLLGKHKVAFQSHLDIGDHVQVVNASKVKIGAKKFDQKFYYRHSGYAKGLKMEALSSVFAKNPGEVIRRAVSRMLPKNKHRTERMKRLNVSN